jgi:hypothetical protein
MTGECGAGVGGPFEGKFRWATQSASSTYSFATGVAFGVNDDIVVGGFYSYGEMQIGTTTLEHQGALDHYEIFLASFGKDKGQPNWALGFPASGHQLVYDIDVDQKTGDIVVTGSFDESVSFDGGTTTLTSMGMGDIYVARFTKDGAPLWSRRFGDSEQQVGINVAIDGAGEVVIAALVYGTLEFGDKTVGTVGNIGLFLGKLDASGKDDWHYLYQNAFYNGEYVGLDVDKEGNIVMTASASGAEFQSSDKHKGDTDVVVVKYDKDGTRLWSRMFGGTTLTLSENGQQWGTAAVFDCAGDVLVTGAFKKDLAFGELPVLVNVDPMDDGDIFLARLRGSDGEPVWAKAFGDAGLQQGSSIDTDNDGNVTLGGVLFDAMSSTGIDLGSGTKHPPSPIDGVDYREDFFIAKYNADGGYLWSRRFGDEFIQEGKIAVDPSGLVAAAGDFHFGIEFAPTPGGQLVDEQHDMFVTVFEP